MLVKMGLEPLILQTDVLSTEPKRPWILWLLSKLKQPSLGSFPHPVPLLLLLPVSYTLPWFTVQSFNKHPLKNQKRKEIIELIIIYSNFLENSFTIHYLYTFFNKKLVISLWLLKMYLNIFYSTFFILLWGLRLTGLQSHSGGEKNVYKTPAFK